MIKRHLQHILVIDLRIVVIIKVLFFLFHPHHVALRRWHIVSVM